MGASERHVRAALAVIRDLNETTSRPLVPGARFAKQVADSLTPFLQVDVGSQLLAHLETAQDCFREAAAREPDRERQNAWTEGRLSLELAREGLVALLPRDG